MGDSECWCSHGMMGNFHATLPRWPRSPYATPLRNTMATFFLWYHWFFENWVQFILIISSPFLQLPLDPAPVLSSQGRQQLNWPDFTIPGQFTEVSSCISFLPKNFSPPLTPCKGTTIGQRRNVSRSGRKVACFCTFQETQSLPPFVF